MALVFLVNELLADAVVLGGGLFQEPRRMHAGT